jgi:hypothetical protein
MSPPSWSEVIRVGPDVSFHQHGRPVDLGGLDFSMEGHGSHTGGPTDRGSPVSFPRIVERVNRNPSDRDHAERANRWPVRSRHPRGHGGVGIGSPHSHGAVPGARWRQAVPQRMYETSAAPAWSCMSHSQGDDRRRADPALKGPHRKAQGNALGTSAPRRTFARKGETGSPAGRPVPPFRAGMPSYGHAVPRALPWAFLSRPYGAKNGLLVHALSHSELICLD